jgi:FKBP-type peptidyl-prolyl cis-trans isomerase 2
MEQSLMPPALKNRSGKDGMIVFPPEEGHGKTDQENCQQIDRIALIEIGDPAVEQV